MAMMCITQVCLRRGVCILFQKGTSAYWSWTDGMCGNLWWSDAQGLVVILLCQKGRNMKVAVASVLRAAE